VDERLPGLTDVGRGQLLTRTQLAAAARERRRPQQHLTGARVTEVEIQALFRRADTTGHVARKLRPALRLLPRLLHAAKRLLKHQAGRHHAVNPPSTRSSAPVT